jgi:ssDNA-binding Zn-finger/Zn-ribbon topoisomerase 1
MTALQKPIDFTRLEACPKCEASWQGKPIPKESRSLFGNNEWFSRVIGISSMQQDRTIAWQCPDCHACWDRDTSRPRESFNPSGVRGLQ